MKDIDDKLRKEYMARSYYWEHQNSELHNQVDELKQKYKDLFHRYGEMDEINITLESNLKMAITALNSIYAHSEDEYSSTVAKELLDKIAR